MASLARQHYARVTAAIAAGNADPDATQDGEQHEVHAAALWEARRTLKGIKSLEAKIAKKRELLPTFDAYVAGVLENGKGAADDILMTVMLWRLDVGDLAGGLVIAEYAMYYGLETPDRFERDTPTIIAEQVAEEALRQLSVATEEQRPNLAAELSMHLARAEALTHDADMHDPVRAKLFKALGYAQRARGGHDAEALEALKRALQLNDRVGVKKDIEVLERQVQAQQNASPPEDSAATDSTTSESTTQG